MWIIRKVKNCVSSWLSSANAIAIDQFHRYRFVITILFYFLQEWCLGSLTLLCYRYYKFSAKLCLNLPWNNLTLPFDLFVILMLDSSTWFEDTAKIDLFQRLYGLACQSVFRVPPRTARSSLFQLTSVIWNQRPCISHQKRLWGPKSKLLDSVRKVKNSQYKVF